MAPPKRPAPPSGAEVAGRRRGARRPPEATPRGVRLALVLALALATFWLGRSTAPSASALPPGTPERLGEPPPGEEILTTVTSTAGLCPCPAPRPKPSEKRRLATRAVPPKPPAKATRPDPTAATAAYLKSHLGALGGCAPRSGEPVRVHVEVHVEPTGAVREGRITNLEPVPSPVARCVLDAIDRLEPPGFDATEPRRFGLTVVL